MASNYYGYTYGNPPYPQSQQQSYPDQYPSTAPAAAASQASQAYYNPSQTQPRQSASAVRQSATDSRSATTQYNGLHFPAPAPARQTVATTSHDLGQSASSTGNAVANSSGGARSNASNMGNVTGYGSGGLYQSSNKRPASQLNQQTDATAGRAHDRAEHALSASTAWNSGNTNSSTVQATSRAATDYGYSYNKPDTASQQQQQQQQQAYYARTSTTPSTTQTASLNSGYDQTQSYSASSSAPQPSSKTSKPSSQRQSNQTYRQPAQSSSKTSYNHNYETSSTKTNTSNATPTYQQSADYGKAYHDDTDASQSYLHRVYTLPQPTPTRNATGDSGSYFLNNHATETSYTPSQQTSKPSTVTQTTPYDRSAQDLGRGSSATTSANSHSYSSSAAAPTQSSQQQYYQDYAAANVAQPQAASYNNVAAPMTSATQAAPGLIPVSASQPAETPTPAAKKTRKSRQSTSQKSPTVKTPKPRAPRKSKASAAAAAAASPVDTSISQQPESLAPQYMLHPTNSVPGQPATNTGTTQSAAIKVDPPSARSQSPSSGAGLDMQTMELHMREMVEKMREYQSRDPTAFQQVWENVKRANPSGAGGKGGAPLSITSSKSTAAVASPQQTIANLAKSAAGQSTPAETGRQAPALGSAASQAQKTVWPATQKGALSQIMSRFFSGLGQACSESYALSLLDSGPTFPELCRKLEAQGYKFDKNKLAHELLYRTENDDSSKAAASSTAAPAISAAKLSIDVPPRTVTPQSMKSFNPRNIKDSITNFVPQDHHHDHSQNFVAPSMIYREVSYPTHIGQPESNVRSDEPSAAPTPVAPPASSPHPVPAKSAKASGKKRVSMANMPQQPYSPAPQTPQTPQMTASGPQQQASVAPQPNFPAELREEPMPDASPVSIVKPISRYESLIQASSPISPFVQSKAKEDTFDLEKKQSKLEAQLSRLKQLEESLELPPTPVSVPSQPAPPTPPQPPQSNRKVNLPRAPALDKKKALRRNAYDSHTIVHAVLQSTGRHPQYEGLNSRLTILKRLHPDVFDNTTDLAQIPWDLYDPPPAPLPGEVRKIKRSVVPDEEEERGRRRERVPFTIGVPRAEPDPVTPTSTEGKIRGKRGRPRGSRGVLRGARGGRGGRGGSTAGGPTGTPNTDANSAGDPSTAANTHKYGNVTRVNINTLRGGNGGNGGDSSRKRKYGNSPDPRYPGDGGSGAWGNGLSRATTVFKCQWEKCNYELQNLETLRKHLLKKHKVENTQGVLPCCWGICGTLIPIGMLDPETGKQIFEQRRRRLNFGTGTAWENHVLGEHLKVLRDELGEGMSVSAARSLSRASSAHSVEGRMRSMSRDRTGRSLTPVITQAPYGYKFTPPPGFSSGSQFRLAHEFPQDIELDSDADEDKFFEEELARMGRAGGGVESFDLFDFPGLAFDTGEGWATKMRKLTTDLSRVAPVPIQPDIGNGDGNREKGKNRADG